jgi:hypothetical protein
MDGDRRHTRDRMAIERDIGTRANSTRLAANGQQLTYCASSNKSDAHWKLTTRQPE